MSLLVIFLSFFKIAGETWQLKFVSFLRKATSVISFLIFFQLKSSLFSKIKTALSTIMMSSGGFVNDFNSEMAALVIH